MKTETTVKLLKQEQLAKRWGLSVNTLRDWRTDRKGPKFIKLGKVGTRSKVRYKVSDIEAYEKKMTKETNGRRRS